MLKPTYHNKPRPFLLFVCRHPLFQLFFWDREYTINIDVSTQKVANISITCANVTSISLTFLRHVSCKITDSWNIPVFSKFNSSITQYHLVNFVHHLQWTFPIGVFTFGCPSSLKIIHTIRNCFKRWRMCHELRSSFQMELKLIENYKLWPLADSNKTTQLKV